MGNTNTHSPLYSQEVLNILVATPLEDSPAEMPLQRARVAFAQVQGSFTAPQGQTSPRVVTTTVSTPPAPSVTVVTTTPTCKTRARWKRPRGASSEHPVTIHHLENSPPNLGDTHVDVIGAPTYVKAFMVDREAFPTTDKVEKRLWEESGEVHGESSSSP